MGIHYFQITDDLPLSPLHDKCMRSVKRFVRKDVDTYQVQIISRQGKSLRDFIQMVDKLKLTKAYSDPNLCIVDRDCFLVKGIHEMGLESGKPHFARFEFNTNHDCPDICLFYVNGCCDYFQRNLPLSCLSTTGYSLEMEALTSLKDYVFIDEMGYVHMYSTMTEILNDRRFTELESSYNFDNLELAQYRQAVKQLALISKMADEGRSRGN